MQFVHWILTWSSGLDLVVVVDFYVLWRIFMYFDVCWFTMKKQQKEEELLQEERKEGGKNLKVLFKKKERDEFLKLTGIDHRIISSGVASLARNNNSEGIRAFNRIGNGFQVDRNCNLISLHCLSCLHLCHEIGNSTTSVWIESSVIYLSIIAIHFQTTISFSQLLQMRECVIYQCKYHFRCQW